MQQDLRVYSHQPNDAMPRKKPSTTQSTACLLQQTKLQESTDRADFTTIITIVPRPGSGRYHNVRF